MKTSKSLLSVTFKKHKKFANFSQNYIFLALFSFESQIKISCIYVYFLKHFYLIFFSSRKSHKKLPFIQHLILFTFNSYEGITDKCFLHLQYLTICVYVSICVCAYAYICLWSIEFMQLLAKVMNLICMLQ